MSIRVKNEKGIFSKLLKLLLNVAIAFVCIIAIFMIYYAFMSQVHSNDKKYKPALSFYTIVSPSMNPVIKVYDVVVNVKVNNPKDINVGDIITYTSTNPTSLGMTITHRVVEVYETDNGNYEYKTQGDNNSEPDSVLVTFDNVIGKKILIIPSLGKLQFLLANKKNWILLLLIPIAIFIFKDLYELLELFGLRKKVDAVTGEVEEPVYVETKKEKETEIKEVVKKEPKVKEIKSNALVRDKNEPSGFLEPYTESILTVGKVEEKKKVKNEVEPMKVVKADKISLDIEEKKPEVKISNKVTTEDKTDSIVDIVNSVKNSVTNKKNEIIDDEINEMIEKTTEKIAEEKVTPSKKTIIEPIKPENRPVIEGKAIIPNTEDKELNEKITMLKPVIAPVEILDTDELTEKIKLYDEKINKLNEMLYSLEDMNIAKSKEIESERQKFKKEVQVEKEKARLEIAKAKEEAKKEIEQSIKKAKEETKIENKEVVVEPVEEVIPEEDFLVGGRIKVVKIEVAQKKRNRKQSIKKIDDEVLLKTSIIPKIGSEEKKKKQSVIIKDKKLKLRDKKVKEVKEENDFPTTDDDLLAEINRFYKKEDKDLMFNPKIVKKINKNETKAPKEPKPRRKGLIYFEKVKDKKKGN